MTDEFEQFERDFLHANTWPQRKDGVPLYLLDQLSPEDRGKAEDVLIEALSNKDSWPAEGLRHIRSTKALPALYSWLGKSRRSVRISFAYAIYQINRDEGMVEIVLAELPKISSQYTLTEVIFLLPIFDDLRIKEVLRKYRNDKRYLVSYNAARALGESTDEVVQEFRKKRSWW